MTEQYPQIDEYILNDSGINVDDYDNFQDFLDDITERFGKQFNDEVYQTTIDIWEGNQIEEPDFIPEELESTQREEIEFVLEKPTIPGKVNQVTRTQEVLEIVKEPLTISEVAEITGKPEPSVRRDLAKGVKLGLWKRIGKKGSKGVRYEEL